MSDSIGRAAGFPLRLFQQVATGQFESLKRSRKRRRAARGAVDAFEQMSSSSRMGLSKNSDPNVGIENESRKSSVFLLLFGASDYPHGIEILMYS